MKRTDLDTRCGCGSAECELELTPSMMSSGRRFHPDCVRPCKCGCGLLIHPAPHSFHRKYAIGCQSPMALNLEAKRGHKRRPRVKLGMPASKLPKRPSHVACLVCFDLPHRREQPGCPKCQRPYHPSP